MLYKRNIGVVSFLSIIALMSVGFSSFYIGTNDASLSILVETGEVLSLNNAISIIEYNNITFGANGFINNEKVENTTEINILISISLDELSLNLIISEENSSINLTSNLSITNDVNSVILSSINSISCSSYYGVGDSGLTPSVTIENNTDAGTFLSNIDISSFNTSASLLYLNIVYYISPSDYSSFYTTISGKTISYSFEVGINV